MAAASTNTRWAVVFLLIAAALVGSSSASTLTAFSGPGCAGKTMDVNFCGCSSLGSFTAGYHFVFTQGQRAKLYKGYNCNGDSIRLDKEKRSCGPHGFNSIRIAC